MIRKHPHCSNIRDNEDVFFVYCVPKQNFFVTFLLKSFVVSIIIATFAVELERLEKNGCEENSND